MNHPLKRRGVITLVLILLFTTAPLFGFGTQESNSAAQPAEKKTVTVTDDRGTEISLPRLPLRIASSALMCDELLINLLPSSRIAAVSAMAADPELSNVADQVPPEIPKITLNAEAVIALKPDILFTALWADEDTIRQIRGAGIAVYQTEVPLTLKAAKDQLSRLAQLVGAEQRAESILEELERQEALLAQLRSEIPEGKRKTVLEYNTWGTTGGKGSTWQEILDLAGCLNGAGDRESDQWGGIPLSRELLVEIDPDILVVPAWVYDNPDGPNRILEELQNDPALRDLTAVKTQQVLQIPEPYKSAANYFLIEGALSLAQFAYPEAASRILRDDTAP